MAAVAVEKKRCTRCGESFPATEEFFYGKAVGTNRSRRVLLARCKRCTSETNMAYERNGSTRGPLLDPEPFRQWLIAQIRATSLKEVCDRTGLADRTATAIRRRERKGLSVSLVDGALTRMGVCLWEVYPELYDAIDGGVVEGLSSLRLGGEPIARVVDYTRARKGATA